MEILEDYLIHSGTFAILPAKEIEFQSIVYENESVLYVKETPLNLIKEACLANWSTYEGRRQAIIKRTGYKEKVPIPISPLESIIAIPTHGIKHLNCAWIMYDQILDHYNVMDKETLIKFPDHHTIKLPLSYTSFNNQLSRAFHIKYSFLNNYKITKDLLYNRYTFN